MSEPEPRRSARLSGSSKPAVTGQNLQPTSPATYQKIKTPTSTAGGPRRIQSEDDGTEDQDEYNPQDDGTGDQDDYAPPEGRGSKKRKSGGSSHGNVPSQKRRLWENLLSEKGQQGLPAIPRNAIDVTITPQFTNTNKFLTLIEHGLRADPGSPQVYAPSSGDMPFVWNLEHLEDRDYVPVEDKLALYNILRNGKQVQVWRLVVRDNMRPEEDDIQIFRLAGSVSKPAFQTSFLDLGLCPARDDALRLLQDACGVLNRYPGNLPAHEGFYEKAGAQSSHSCRQPSLRELSLPSHHELRPEGSSHSHRCSQRARSRHSTRLPSNHCHH
ncbi:hypothetical protein KCU67_g3749, partial [Aureobasidium melanogenum]